MGLFRLRVGLGLPLQALNRLTHQDAPQGPDRQVQPDLGEELLGERLLFGIEARKEVQPPYSTVTLLARLRG